MVLIEFTISAQPVAKVLSRRTGARLHRGMNVTLWCSLSTCWTAAQWLVYWLGLGAGLALIVTALRAPGKRKDENTGWRRLFQLRRSGPRT